MHNFKTSIDARMYPPREKHSTIFKAFNSLEKGEIMELVNDHDPSPLHYQLKAEYPNAFSWEYLEQGPEVWKVAISKIQ